MQNNDRNKAHVTFNERNTGYARTPRRSQQPWLVRTVIRLGLAKNAKQASVVLVVIAVLAIGFMFVLWPSGTDYEIVPQPGQAVQ